MGELAEDMINGRSCEWCGVYFKKEHGYPVLCNDCYEPNSGHSKATIKEL